MASKAYRKVFGRDADVLSDASGSDASGEHDTGRDTTSRRRPRNSEDVRRHDRDTLEAEEEAERLLSGEARGLGSIFRSDQSKRKQPWFKSRGSRDDDLKEVADDVEQGAQRHGEEHSDASSEFDLKTLGMIQTKRRWVVLRWTRFICLHLLILVVFVLLLFGAFQASRAPARPQLTKTMSNGTHTFYPTTVIISLDGFRADFLQRGLTPTLNAFIKDGVSPKYMMPSFPSVTFANHFTLATGHYPESHGIVGNTFWDPSVGKEFYYTDPTRSLQPEWWQAEPFWLSAEMQGVSSAIHMWPGSEAHIGALDPAFVDHFDGAEQLDNKVNRILGWLDLPGPGDEGYNIDQPRPQLIAAYVPDVDTDGHNYGPNSTEIKSTIQRVDNMLADIFRGIDERNLTSIVNIIVVSDHGMATTDVTRLIQLEDLLDPGLIEHTDGWPLYGLRPYDTSDEMLHKIYDQVLNKSKEERYQHSFDVYLRDENMPERYHFSHNGRIAPLWIVPKTGWAIVTEAEFNVAKGLKSGDVYHPRGLHGYDHEHPLMRAIFVARGPAFPHPKGSQIEPFQNIEVYNILCDSLGIEPAENNGTIRLPFSTNGLHDDSKAQDAPADPPERPVNIPAIAPVPIPTGMPEFEIGDGGPSPTVQQSVIWTTDAQGSLVTMIVDSDGHPLRPWTPVDSGTEQDDNINNHKSWWGWWKDQYQDFKDWTGSVFHPHPDKEEGWEVVGLNMTR